MSSSEIEVKFTIRGTDELMGVDGIHAESSQIHGSCTLTLESDAVAAFMYDADCGENDLLQDEAVLTISNALYAALHLPDFLEVELVSWEVVD